MDRCASCGLRVEEVGFWVEIDRRRYVFCSPLCANQYEPVIEHEIVI
jgi:hypothetical protein